MLIQIFLQQSFNVGPVFYLFHPKDNNNLYMWCRRHMMPRSHSLIRDTSAPIVETLYFYLSSLQDILMKHDDNLVIEM